MTTDHHPAPQHAAPAATTAAHTPGPTTRTEPPDMVAHDKAKANDGNEKARGFIRNVFGIATGLLILIGTGFTTGPWVARSLQSSYATISAAIANTATAPATQKQAARADNTTEESGGCYIKPKPFTYKPVWQFINRGAHCKVELYYDEAQVDLFFRQKGSSVNLGPYHRGTEIPIDAEQIWSATTFEGEVALPPPTR